MVIEGEVYTEIEIRKFDTILATGQYSYIDPKDPFYENVYTLLHALNPKYFRSHNNYDDDYIDDTRDDSFQIVEPYPVSHKDYRWDFSKLDEKVSMELRRCDRETYIYNIRTCPPWMLDKTKSSPLFPKTSGVVIDKTYQQLADFCARIVGWYNKGGFFDEKGKYHSSGHYYNIKYWEILNEQDEGESAIYIKDGKKYAKAYDAIVKAVKKVDPEVLCGGPSQSCVPTENHDLTYIKDFLENTNEKVDFLTIHYYSDQSGLIKSKELGSSNEKNNSNIDSYEKYYMDSIKDIASYFEETKKLTKKYGNMPVYLSETNLCLRNTLDRPSALGEVSQGCYGVAWFGYLFKIAAEVGINVIQQYQYYCPIKRSRHLKNFLSLINNKTGEAHLTYWFMKALNDFYKDDGIIIKNNFSGNIEVLSVKYPTRKELLFLVIKKGNNDKTKEKTNRADINIDIDLGGFNIEENSIKAIKLDEVNKKYEINNTIVNLIDNNKINLYLEGYGIALIEISYD